MIRINDDNDEDEDYDDHGEEKVDVTKTERKKDTH